MIYYYTRQSSSSSIYPSCTVQECVDYFKDKQWVEVDTETTGSFNRRNTILLIQFGDADRQYVLNFPELSLEERTLINTDILCNPKLTKLLHNSKFDIKFFWHHGMDIVNIYDTMLAELILNAGRDTDKGFYSLYGLCQRYLGITLDKETRGIINKVGITSRVIEYAANDVKYLSLIAEEQIRQMQKYRLASSDLQDLMTVCGLEMNAILALASIEYNGMYLDRTKWAKVKEIIHQQVNEVEKNIDTLVNAEPTLGKFSMTYQDLFTPAYKTTSVNWNSHTQKLKVLKSLFPEIKSTDERTLSKYKQKHPLVKELLRYNKARKLATAFADRLEEHINPVTKRIHTDFWPILDTGRVSTSNPNLQQIPSRTQEGRMMRACFTPMPGNSMVGGDYGGCELRIIAEFSGDPVWINIFKEGKDLHSELCAMTFDIPLDKVKTASHFKPDLQYRDIQKTIDFGLAYGMSEYKLADTIEVTVDEASGIIKKFFSKVPIVEKFLNTLGLLAKTRGFIRTPKPYQRLRWFEGYDNKDDFKRQGEIERAGKNTPIQGGNADMTKLALVLVYREIKKHNYPVKIVHVVHDEIQTECPKEFAETWRPILQRLMIQAAEVILKNIPMEVDCKISDHWSK